MKYLKLFQTLQEYDAYKTEGIVRPNVSYIKNTAVVFNGTIPPLYIEAIEDTTITFSKNAIEYSLNNSTWEALPANTATPVIPAGGKVFFRANGLVPTRDNGIGTFSTTGKCNVGGNIMSMAYGEDYASQETVANDSQFAYLFENANNIVDASELLLPATTLRLYCYGGMFYKCTNLLAAPKEIPAANSSYFSVGKRMKGSSSSYTHGMYEECVSLVSPSKLPATILADNCYTNMYRGCVSLTKASELPATTLARSCYFSMYYGCTSLVVAPVLPATSLVTDCYSNMFYGCNNLNYIKAFFKTTPSNDYTAYWVNGVAATGTFVKNAAATWNVTGVNGIPSGWTVETAEA